ncbi:uncharacterized protein LOC122320851 [Drosophila ficusphila]|uniref:uncharacterized protein LOC108098819 n=1 Tax=Drosophila ficusphila TaxID=30025 RepID=UPI0007E85B05|nr:uncharacterized protein LOC108098819 [Drosophila ficusphila]XP_043065266.1 uncharacterized protein LOC122320845 [Drosophila ficusphila]XP_043065270.1 uncharacterized protein LOC122320849 [Drosophila ficusphila]XP_043065271.1 uncharacterized protein LOC122320850 [Drosophila ficusphila]XP_043065272.1 uncharacterized protein LOC122320851 [Drosophila ficusphila]
MEEEHQRNGRYRSQLGGYQPSQRSVHMHHHFHDGHQQELGSAPPLQRESNNRSSETLSNGGVEPCRCRTDPDAMFLMSLLPDIQTLDGRDRESLKIGMRTLLQNLLHP